MKKINKFFSLSFNEKLLFSEALFWLILAKITLLILPFRKILPLLKNNKANCSDCHPERSRRATDVTDATNSTTLIRDSIARASAATPWNSTCLLKSMAARWMLKQRKIQSRMSIGMGKDEGGQRVMHAEIRAKGIEIVGKINEFKELYLFE